MIESLGPPPLSSFEEASNNLESFWHDLTQTIEQNIQNMSSLLSNKNVME